MLSLPSTCVFFAILIFLFFVVRRPFVPIRFCCFCSWEIDVIGAKWPFLCCFSGSDVRCICAFPPPLTTDLRHPPIYTTLKWLPTGSLKVLSIRQRHRLTVRGEPTADWATAQLHKIDQPNPTWHHRLFLSSPLRIKYSAQLETEWDCEQNEWVVTTSACEWDAKMGNEVELIWLEVFTADLLANLLV